MLSDLLDPAEFKDWLHISEMTQVRRVTDLKHATIFLDPSLSAEATQAAMKTITAAAGNDKILVSSSTGMSANLTEAFFGAIQSVEGAFDNVVAGKPQKVRLLSDYLEEDHFLLETPAGQVRVARIEFLGELRVEEISIPIAKTAEYRGADDGEKISQLAAFAPQAILGMNFAMELHRIAATGETHVTMHRLPDGALEFTQQVRHRLSPPK